MSLKIETQRIITTSNVDDCPLTWLEAFLVGRKSEGGSNWYYVFLPAKDWMLAWLTATPS